MSKIFVIEDELAINRMLCLHLGICGYPAVPAYDGKEALLRLRSGERFDLALLDAMLPGMDGFALLPELRSRGIPVIFLTAKADLASKLQGLTGGAEDYIVKPFEMPELLVRMEKVLARTGRADTLLTIGDLRINTGQRTVFRGNTPVALTPLEFDLLLLLVRNRNIALPRERLLSEVWGILADVGTRTADVHIAQLRKKTGLNIVSVPKIGYRLETEA